MFRQITVSAISIKPKKWDKAANADKLEKFFRSAARHHPDLILATEGVLEGYVSVDVQKHPEKARAMLDIAEPIDGPYIRRFRKLARALKTSLCFGFAEKIGHEVYNSAVFIDSSGHVCGTYHKHEEPILLAGGGRPVWTARRRKRRLRAFDTPLGRCGILICADRWYGWVARTLVLDGARFLLIPAYGSTEKPQSLTVLARARENGVPVAEANVGLNLLISRGEIVAHTRGVDRITTGVLDVPQPPSLRVARSYERAYLRRRDKEDWRWLAEPRRSFPPIGTRTRPGRFAIKDGPGRYF